MTCVDQPVKEPEAFYLGEEKASYETLLSPSGRVFIAVLQNPESSLKELSEQLTIGESRISKIISSLVHQELLVRTKLGLRNTYQIGEKAAKTHPDIAALLAALTSYELTS